ncbi:MAG: hypothetical protein WCS96_14925, partial [Victivallales bacterium]
WCSVRRAGEGSKFPLPGTGNTTSGIRFHILCPGVVFAVSAKVSNPPCPARATLHLESVSAFFVLV